MENADARNRFAEANGWSFTRSRFTFDAMARGMPHGGKSNRDLSGFGYDPVGHGALDHAEYFKTKGSLAQGGGRAVAILAHNYGDRAMELREIAGRFAELGIVLHVPAAGKAASWYYPGATLPMLLTRSGVSVVWPSAEEMAGYAVSYADEVARRARADRYWRERSLPDPCA